jgi:phosphoribosylaminoimidazole-succinocarboxamide synthase
MAALINTDLPGLNLISKGKVRDIYSTSSSEHLLFVATDRISAYDVILKNVCGFVCQVVPELISFGQLLVG